MLGWHTSPLLDCYSTLFSISFFGRSPKIGPFVLRSPGARGWHGQELMGNFQQCWRTQTLFSFPSWSFASSTMGVMLAVSKCEAVWIAKAAVLGGTEKPELCTSNGPWMQNRMEEALARGRGWISPACPRQKPRDGKATPPPSSSPAHPPLTTKWGG